MPLETPVKVDFSSQVMEQLKTYVHEHITSYKVQYKDLHENRIPKMRKLYRGVPREENKSFPWPNCSNLVVQVIGQSVDTLRARVLGNIFEISPLVVAHLSGSWKAEEEGEDQREAMEEFLNLMGLEPNELDLYRVYSSGFGETIKFGTAFWKLPWETLIEQEVVSIGHAGARETVVYDGPRPEKLRFETYCPDPHVNTLEQSEFDYHIRELNKYQLLERRFKGLYDKAAVDKIIATPDRTGPSQSKQEADADKGITPAQDSINLEWDIYECWLKFWHDNKKYSIIYTYHYSTKTVLRAVFNFYPNNMKPIEMARLGYDGEDGLFGYGFCEMLEHYQEEISTTHNQRMDAATLANTSIARVSKSSKLDSIFSLFPNAVFPGEKDEFEVMQMGRQPVESVQYESMALSEANSRAGVEPAAAGTGGGTQNPRKGIYSAMGTFSVMQEGNRRVNINTADMRYAHIKIARKLALMYAHFGIGDRIKYMGEKAPLLIKALNNYKSGRMIFPIKAATASVNRELEKQNDMLLTNIMRQHNMGIAQILAQITGPNAQVMPPELKDYLAQTVTSSNYLMSHILRNFGHDDVSRFLPQPDLKKGARGNATGQGAKQGNGTVEQGAANQGDRGQPALPANNAQEGSNNQVV